MGAMLLPSALRQQPRQRLPLDRTNPLGAKVIEHIPLNGGASTASGATVSYSSGGSTAAGIKGRGLRGTGAASRASVPLDLSQYGAVTIAFWFYWDAYANDDALAMELGATYSTNSGFIIDPNCSSPAAFMFGSGGTSGGGGSNLATFARPSAGAWHRIVLAIDRSSSAGVPGLAYVDGVLQSMSPFPGASATSGVFGSDTLHLLSRNESSLFGVGNLQDVTIYRGVLSQTEVTQDYVNTWQIFRAPPSRALRAAVGASPAAPADTSLTGAAAAVASAFGGLSTSIRLSGGGGATASAAGALSTSIVLRGAAVAAITATGALAGGGAMLAGAAVVSASAAGALSTAIPLAGTARAEAAASGALGGSSAGLSGAARAEATATGVLSTGILLGGSAVAQASASGALSTSIQLKGPAAAVASAYGTLATKITLAGAASASASATGALSTAPPKFDISKIHFSRIVVFEGSGSRVTRFE